MGLAPLYGIGPRSDVGGRTRAKSGEVFSRSEVGERLEVRGRTAELDEKRHKNFFLEMPYFDLRVIQK